MTHLNNMILSDSVVWNNPSNLIIVSKILSIFDPMYPFINWTLCKNGDIEIKINIKLAKENIIPYNSIEITDDVWEMYPILLLQFQLNGRYVIINRVSAHYKIIDRRLYYLDENNERNELCEYLHEWGINITNK